MKLIGQYYAMTSDGAGSLGLELRPCSGAAGMASGPLVRYKPSSPTELPVSDRCAVGHSSPLEKAGESSALGACPTVLGQKCCFDEHREHVLNPQPNVGYLAGVGPAA